MIINQEESNKIVIGETKENKVSIDPENINFITTLLSSNLYSNPKKSFLREIISNAWDAHVEAHNENTPVIVSISDNSISIRDFGLGLSPERFNKIFLNIGSSTKRGDNSQIGGWGLGRFAPLSCSNMVTFKSYYNGKQYTYLMIKDGNSINIDLVNILDTKEKNGLDVSISINTTNDELETYTQYLEDLIFFPNVYIDDIITNKTEYSAIRAIERYNNSKIKYYDNFAYSINNSFEDEILLGYVLYPMDREIRYQIYDEYGIDFNALYSNHVALKFNIGELDITPNRENLLYSNKTKKAIFNKVEAFIDEISKDFIKENCIDFDNIINYCKVWGDCYINIVFYKTDNSITDGSTRINTDTFIEYITNKGISIPTYKGNMLNREHLRYTYTCYKGANLPGLLGLIWRDKYYNKKYPRIYTNNPITIDAENIVEIPKDTRILPMVRKYILSKYGNGTPLVESMTEQEIKDYLLTLFPKSKCNYSEDYADAYYKIYKSKLHKFNPLDKEYLDFKEKNKEIRVKADTSLKVTIEYKEYDKPYILTRYCNSLNEAYDYVSESGKGFIVTNKRNKNKGIIQELANKYYLGAVFVNLNLVDGFLKLPNAIKEEDVLNPNNRFLVRLNTIKEAIPNEDIIFMKSFLYFINNKDIDAINNVINQYHTLLITSPDIIGYINKNVSKVDSILQEEITLFKKYTKKFREFNDDVKPMHLSVDDNRLAYAFFMYKTKFYKIPYSIYKQIKKIPILNK